MFKKAFFSVLALLFMVYSCKKDALQSFTCTGATPTYSAQIKPIMDAKCATSGCHSAAKKAGGIDLSNYASAKSEAASKAFLGSMEHLNGYKAMPQDAAKLPDSTIQKIHCWVNNGTPQ